MIPPLVCAQAAAVANTRTLAYSSIAHGLAKKTSFELLKPDVPHLFISTDRKTLFRPLDRQLPRDICLAEKASLVCSLAHLAGITSVVTHVAQKTLSLPGPNQQAVPLNSEDARAGLGPFQVRRYHRSMLLISDLTTRFQTVLSTILQRLDEQSHRAILFVHALGCLDMHNHNIGLELDADPIWHEMSYFLPHANRNYSLELLAREYLRGNFTADTLVVPYLLDKAQPRIAPTLSAQPLATIPNLIAALTGPWKLLFFDIDHMLGEGSDFTYTIADGPEERYLQTHHVALRSHFLALDQNNLMLPSHLIDGACNPDNDQPLIDWLEHADAAPYLRMAPADRKRVREAVMAIARQPHLSTCLIEPDTIVPYNALRTAFVTEMTTNPDHNRLWALLKELLPGQNLKPERLAAALCPRVSGRTRDVIVQRFEQRRQFLTLGQQLRSSIAHTPERMAILQAIVEAPCTPITTAERARLRQQLTALHGSDDSLFDALSHWMEPSHKHIIQAMYPLLPDLELLHTSVLARHPSMQHTPDTKAPWYTHPLETIGGWVFSIERMVATALHDLLRAHPPLQTKAALITAVRQYGTSFGFSKLQKALQHIEAIGIEGAADEWHSLLTVAKAFSARYTNSTEPPAFFMHLNAKLYFSTLTSVETTTTT